MSTLYFKKVVIRLLAGRFVNSLSIRVFVSSAFSMYNFVYLSVHLSVSYSNALLAALSCHDLTNTENPLVNGHSLVLLS